MEKNFFQNKRVTVMGLGLLGGAVNDIKFLVKRGALVTVTDLKSAKELAPSLAQLKKYHGIKYVLGRHRLVDFQRADFVLQPGNVPLDSKYLAAARKNHIPIHISESIFFQVAQDQVKIIGITGTRGKSTTTQLIFEILFRAGWPVHLAGNVRGISTLPLLDKIKPGDWVVLELDSWSLAGLRQVKASPHIAVFTNFFRDHQNFYHNNLALYFADKAEIFLHQRQDDFLFCGITTEKLIRQKYKKISSQVMIVRQTILPKSWRIKLLGEHNRLNIAYAVAVARQLKVKEKIIRQVVENYSGLPGRLELVRTWRGVRYYNDTTATTPEGVIAALKSFPAGQKNIILLGGGADKNLQYDNYVKILKSYLKILILFRGSATDKIIAQLPRQKNYRVIVVDSMAAAFQSLAPLVRRGDIVLLSPGAASFGLFVNEFDRGDQFTVAVKKIK